MGRAWKASKTKNKTALEAVLFNIDLFTFKLIATHIVWMK